MRRDTIFLYERAPAKKWEESFLLGNGSLGASVFGNTEKEKIILNHDTLWSGYPRKNEVRGEGKSSLYRAKALLKEKKYVEADSEIAANFSSYATDCYLPMAELELEFLNLQGKVSGYKRTLDLSKGVFEASYNRGKAKYYVRSYVSYPDNMFVWRVKSEGGGFSLKVGLTSQLYSKTYSEGNSLYLEGECPVTSQQNIDRTDRKTLYYEDPQKRGIRFMTALKVISDGERVAYDEGLTTNGNYIEIKNTSYIEIRLVARTSYNGSEKHPFLEGSPYASECRAALAKCLEKQENELLSRHIKDHKRYFSRVSLEIDSPLMSRVPTSERLKRFADDDSDKALYVLLFNLGRYLTIAGSRRGSQAMNLQGIWNPHFFAPWHSNYTVNINTQMNYFPTLAIGLDECYEPLIRLIKEVSESGRATADRFYGAEGWVCHHNTDLWRNTQPVAGMTVWLFWNACGAWLCRHLYEYYEYTLDKGFLEKTAYPIMRESARFYLSQLEDSEDGYRIIFASTSPENRFVCENGLSAVSETTEMTMAAVRELFSSLAKTADIIGADDEVIESVRKELPKLRPTMVGSDGRILEWYGEMKERELTHRHVSHLYGLHPSDQISPLKTPELAKACRKTLEVRGDDGTGWSLAWKCNFFARLMDGDHALLLLKQQLRLCDVSSTVYTKGGGSYPNLMCAHPPFQIDGNFGATSGIVEMLIQSSIDEIHLLPALPTEWKDLKVTKFRAKGRRKVSFTVKSGELSECKIYGNMPKRIILNSIDITGKFTFENGIAVYKK